MGGGMEGGLEKRDMDLRECAVAVEDDGTARSEATTWTREWLIEKARE